MNQPIIKCHTNWCFLITLNWIHLSSVSPFARNRAKISNGGSGSGCRKSYYWLVPPLRRPVEQSCTITAESYIFVRVLKGNNFVFCFKIDMNTLRLLVGLNWYKQIDRLIKYAIKYSYSK